MIVNKPVLQQNSKCYQLCFLGLFLLSIGQSSVRAEFYDPSGLNLSGSLAYTYGFNKTDNLESEFNSVRVAVNGSSSIWQPWFATVAAGLGLGLGTSENTSSNAPENSFTSSNINLAFAVFPLSRFPFQLSYSASRNEADSVANSLDGLASATLVTTRTRFGISQAYTALNRTHINFFYNRSDFESIFSNFQSSIAGLRVNRSWAKQRYSIDSNFIDSKQKDIGTGSTSFSLTATHGFLPSTEMGITSLLTHSTAKSKSPGSVGSESTTNQVSTSVSWHPDHKPYSVSGGARFSKSTTDNVLGTTDSNSVGIGLTASYRFSRQVRGNLTINANSSESEGRQALNSSELATIGFFSAPTTFYDFSYNWSLNGSMTNSNNKIDGNDAATPPVVEKKTDSQSASVAASHGLSRSWGFGSGSLNFSFSESLSVSKSFVDEADPAVPAVPAVPEEGTETDELTRSHSMSFHTGVNHQGWGGYTIFSIAASDSRTLEDDGVVFQLATIALARNQTISRLSSASGNFNYQVSKTDDPLSTDEALGGTEETASIRFAYNHNRFLGVHALTYASTLRQDNLIPGGDSIKGNISWTNALSYAIGLISANLNVRITETPSGERTLSGSFSATRSF